MSMSTAVRIGTVFLLCGGLSLAGCHQDDMFSPCPLSQSIWTQACQPKPGVGQSCLSTSDCAEDLSCTKLDLNGVCSGDGDQAGAPCAVDGECGDGLECDKSQVEGVCTDGSGFTCVVEEHPFCLEAICAAWEGGQPQCTRACTSSADCPTGATCQEHLGVSFCVDGAPEPGNEPGACSVFPVEDEPGVFTNNCPGTGQTCCGPTTDYPYQCVPRDIADEFGCSMPTVRTE